MQLPWSLNDDTLTQILSLLKQTKEILICFVCFYNENNTKKLNEKPVPLKLQSTVLVTSRDCTQLICQATSKARFFIIFLIAHLNKKTRYTQHQKYEKMYIKSVTKYHIVEINTNKKVNSETDIRWWI